MVALTIPAPPSPISVLGGGAGEVPRPVMKVWNSNLYRKLNALVQVQKCILVRLVKVWTYNFDLLTGGGSDYIYQPYGEKDA